MRCPTEDDVRKLLRDPGWPCVSIHLPLKKTHSNPGESLIAYRHLIDAAEHALSRAGSRQESRPLIEKLRSFEDRGSFKENGHAGVAVFLSPATFESFGLRHPPVERVAVGDSFLIRPLLRMTQSGDRFSVLCLQRDEIRLYEGNRDGLTRITPDGVPLTLKDYLRTEAVVTQDPKALPGTRHEQSPPGPGAAGTNAKIETERFFQAIDRAVWEHVSRPSGLPLVVVAMPETQTSFRALSQNPKLHKTGVEKSPERMPDDELLKSVWACLEPDYLAQLDKLVNEFGESKSHDFGSDDLATAARAAFQGRVGNLLVEAEAVKPGRINPETGEIEPSEEAVAGDILDELAGMVFGKDGEVVVVPADRMPTKTGLAASYRF